MQVSADITALSRQQAKAGQVREGPNIGPNIGPNKYWAQYWPQYAADLEEFLIPCPCYQESICGDEAAVC